MTRHHKNLYDIITGSSQNKDIIRKTRTYQEARSREMGGRRRRRKEEEEETEGGGSREHAPEFVGGPTQAQPAASRKRAAQREMTVCIHEHKKGRR